MARRERTTGLPRARQRSATVEQSRGVDERTLRFAVLGVGAVVLLVVLGFLAYRIYDQRVGVPNSPVLTVAGEEASLRYYTDRLGPFVQENANSGASLAVVEENLLTKLEEEELTVRIAEQRGIDLSDDAVTQFIADGFGVPVGGNQSSYDSFYRNELRTNGFSDATYRRMKKAELADARLQEQLKEEVGTSGEQYTARIVLASSEEEAASIHARIAAGEDMGTIAQTDSIDLESRQNDGLLPPEPLELFPPEVRPAVEGAEPGTLLEPVQVGDNWWVTRVESVAEADYTEGQITTLTTMRLTELIEEERANLGGQIERSLSADDIEWAEEHASLPTGG